MGMWATACMLAMRAIPRLLSLDAIVS